MIVDLGGSVTSNLICGSCSGALPILRKKATERGLRDCARLEIVTIGH